MQKLWKRSIGLALMLALAVGGWLTWNALAAAPRAPDVNYPLLTGQTLDSHALRGKVVLVDFWATSCTTCVGEMPQLVQTYKQLAHKGFNLVAVSMSYDRPDFVQNFVRSGPAGALPFPVVFDRSGDIAQAFGGVRLTPTSFLIDKSGHIVKQYVGPPNFVELHALINQLLSEQA